MAPAMGRLWRDNVSVRFPSQWSVSASFIFRLEAPSGSQALAEEPVLGAFPGLAPAVLAAPQKNWLPAGPHS